ncbi:MAG TPA: hypothetical protein VK956_17290, partial [Verrucomicrobium sp.]|nr:hypothetical protein [Verrucomicrobium sp.]
LNEGETIQDVAKVIPDEDDKPEGELTAEAGTADPEGDTPPTGDAAETGEDKLGEPPATDEPS